MSQLSQASNHCQEKDSLLELPMCKMMPGWTSRPNISGTAVRGALFRHKSVQLSCPSNRKTTTAACYRRHELEKWRAYERRILEVEHGSFTSLEFSTSGGWGPSATIAFKRLASHISTKLSQSYSTMMNFIQCKITFSLMNSTVMCLRGARSSFHQPARELNLAEQPLDLVAREAQLSA